MQLEHNPRERIEIARGRPIDDGVMAQVLRPHHAAPCEGVVETRQTWALVSAKRPAPAILAHAAFV